jgi:hypothetical protein
VVWSASARDGREPRIIFPATVGFSAVHQLWPSPVEVTRPAPLWGKCRRERLTDGFSRRHAAPDLSTGLSDPGAAGSRA